MGGCETLEEGSLTSDRVQQHKHFGIAVDYMLPLKTNSEQISSDNTCSSTGSSKCSLRFCRSFVVCVDSLGLGLE